MFIILFTMQALTSSAQTMSPRTHLWVWTFYDFANSLANIIVAFYFSLFVVGQLGKSDAWVSVPVALTTLLLLFTLPYFGSVADRIKKYKPALAITTLLSIVSLFLMGISAVHAASSPFYFMAVIVFYFLFQYFYQAAFGFYLPFLQSLSKTNARSWVASLGLAVGQLGSIVGLVIAYPLAESSFSILGLSKIPLAFCVGAVLFLVCYAIFHVYFKEEQYRGTEMKSIFPHSFRELLQQVASLRHEKNVLFYLLAYYLFADAVLTLQLFASLYLDQVGHMASGMKTLGFVVAIFGVGIGALLTSRLIGRIGNLKRAIGGVILVWVVLLFGFALAQNQTQMFVLLVLNGLATGLLFSMSRIMYSKLIPADEPGRYFGIYVLFERFASVLGPLLWSLTTFAFAFTGPETKYRLAVSMLAILVLISYFFLRKVKEEYRSGD